LGFGFWFGVWSIRRRNSRTQGTITDLESLTTQVPEAGPDNDPLASVIQPFTGTQTSSTPTKGLLATDPMSHSSTSSLEKQSPSSSTEFTVTTDAGNRTEQAAIVAHQPAGHGAPSPSALPTEELVRLLNDRLRNPQWDAREPPPEYLQQISVT
jgi:hypothetical protein